MNKKLYYWGHDLDQYSSDNVEDYGEIIEIKRLNFLSVKIILEKAVFLEIYLFPIILAIFLDILKF